jgi:hypothetical protein
VRKELCRNRARCPPVATRWIIVDVRNKAWLTILLRCPLSGLVTN